MFASEPQPTPYDLRFHLAGIPVRVHPLFWLLGVILGAQAGEGMDLLVYILIWVGVVFVSILVHELGHALMMRYFGQGSSIILYVMGGLTVPESSAWQSGSSRRPRGPTEQILISAAGPAVGFSVAGLIVGAIFAAGGFAQFDLWYVIPVWRITLPPSFNEYWYILFDGLLFVNVFWGLMNLLPVYPLDGGQISRELFLMGDAHSGVEKSLWLSVLAGGFVAVSGLVLLKSILLALLFGSLAFSSYQILQQYGGRRW